PCSSRPLLRSLFFFASYAAHRHLPSFPTRRSSDLVSPLQLAEDFCGEGGDLPIITFQELQRLVINLFTADSRQFLSIFKSFRFLLIGHSLNQEVYIIFHRMIF